MDDDPLLTVVEVARILHFSTKTVSCWARDGRVPKTPDGRPGAFKLGGHWRFRSSIISGMADGSIWMPQVDRKP